MFEMKFTLACVLGSAYCFFFSKKKIVRTLAATWGQSLYIVL